MMNDGRNSIWQRLLLFKRYVRYTHDVNHCIRASLIAETYNCHLYIVIANECEKTMEIIEAHHERRLKFDLATDFTIRKVREMHARYKSFH